MSQRFDTIRSETLGAGAMVFGLLSLGLCWWFPFGAVLGICGIGFGLASRLAGKSRHSAIGMIYSAGGVASAMLLVWDRLLGI